LGKLDNIINDHTSVQIASLMESIEEKFENLPTADVDNSELIGAIEGLGDRFKPTDMEPFVEAISDIRFPEVNFPKTISVDNFPVQKYPMPVTNININGLKGPIKSTAITVGSTAVPLPATALSSRRSLIVWNNDNSTTLWIGGSDVTVANGIPVKKQNYSPALDLADTVHLYGITSGSDIDVRVLESSMSSTG